jgi:solute carrier family 25 (mitochondrial aspartate/glutamate transporter), member 12/13
MARVKEAVKASLVGISEEPQLSQQIKAHFQQHARKDDQTGESYMAEEDFVDAIAPKSQDYVSLFAEAFWKNGQC